MLDERGPLDLALEVLVYLPVGLAVSGRELATQLAERGRERVTGQLTSARVLGEFVVQQGQLRAGRAFKRAREDAQERLGATPPPAATAPPARPATSGPAAEMLAVPGYDSLSASQVLPRLEGLSASELEAVRSYEAAHRGRKTILGRVAQLQTDS